ncbi:MAG TPA: DUF3459 domain-containing protein, partial [Mycobacteriales bacterium]|nr:DUF3459 domain-containing protein [Mycobacteriales bacterium]
AALVLLSPFVPMLFQGEEWGARTPFLYFTDHDDPELADAVRTGRRAEFAAFGWRPEDVPDPQAVETFERSQLDWSELGDAAHARLLDWHRSLIALRRRTDDLLDSRPGHVRVEVDVDRAWLVMTRGAVHVAANLSGQPQDVPLPDDRSLSCELSSQPVELRSPGVVLPAHSVAVLTPTHPGWVLRADG